MYQPNFCVECGERLAPRGWLRILSRAGGRFCDDCRGRLGKSAVARSLVTLALIGFAAFALGRWLRPAAPPLIIQRSASSPLSDLQLDSSGSASTANRNGFDQGQQNESTNVEPADDTVYLCGARTRKGTPCRRRVHSAGERCYQHKGMPAMVPPEKLVVNRK